MEKILKTRISQLKKTLAEWELIKDTFIPYFGELCIVDDNGNIKFKVGDGQSFFKDLHFVGGESDLTLIAGDGISIEPSSEGLVISNTAGMYLGD